MSLQIPQLDSLTTRLVADYQARFPAMDVSRFSDNWKRLRTLSVAVWGLYHTIRVAYGDLFPDTASGSALDRLGGIWGVPRKGPTAARKAAGLRVTGVPGSALAPGDELTHARGLRFQVTAAATIPASGQRDVDVAGLDVGSATRLDAGQVLTFVSSPAGIDARAELQLDLDEDGADAESDGAYRVRILARIGQPGMGGNANDYRQWALEAVGVSETYVYPLRAGRGSLDIVALHDASGSARLLTVGERAELHARITSDRPVAMKAFRVLDVVTRSVSCEVLIEAKPGPEWRWDWDDQAAPVAVGAWDVGTRTLTFVAPRPTDLEPGDRVVLSDGMPIEVEAFGGLSTEVVLKSAPAVVPVPGASVHAGGHLTKPVREAVLAHYRSLGPAVGRYGTGEWDCDLHPRRLEAIALGIEGVRNAQAPLPVAPVIAIDPPFPNDEALELIIPANVVVRRA